MISCIICSRKSDISAELKQNIQDTIGTDYELIIIDNSHNRYSICSAYNEGVRRAKGNILIFMHEDVIFWSKQWGYIIEQRFFQYQDIGIIGLLGGHYLPATPCYWIDARVDSVNHIQSNGKEGNSKVMRIVCHQQYRSERTFVAACDGVFMAMPKCLFDENLVRWDENVFRGFHFYDMDMSMQIHKIGLNIEILWDVLLEHKSCGDFNKMYLAGRDVWFYKWKQDLPIMCGVDLTQEQIEIANTNVGIANAMYEAFVRNASLLRSKEYRLGKFLLKPFFLIHRVLKRKKDL